MDRDLASWARSAPRWLWALAVALLCAACGGGVGTGGTGAFASGPITGFGSIVVNGVHFDESAARVEDDDGSGRSRDELRLGMMVEVQSGEIRDGAATASQVRIVSALVGAVQSKASDSLVVNGLTVRINAGTVVDDSLTGGLAGVDIGRVVEVFGFVEPVQGSVIATRIEPDDNAAAFKFRGVVANFSALARTFDIGGQHFVYSGQVSGVGELRNGALVRVQVQTQVDALGRWVVKSIGNTGPGGGDRDQAKARGVITSFASNASFTVDGFAVDASAAQIEGGPLAAGLRVEVEGRLQAGVLIASSVEVEDDDEHDELELRGVIATLDDQAKVFTISGRSERISYAGSVQYERGSAADLLPGRRVRATGMLSPDGTQLDATHIRFDN